MITKIYSLKDLKTDTFKQPFFQHSKGEALRTVTDLAKDPQSIVQRYPDDFHLYEIGTYNDENADIRVHETPEKVMEISELIKSTD